MCKIKFIKEIDHKFNSIKLIKNYSKIFNGEEKIYFSKSDILNPFEENYGMFLINFINADFSSFASAYLTYFCFYGIGLLAEFYNNIPEVRAFNTEQDFKDTYKDIFNQAQIKLKELQNTIRFFEFVSSFINVATSFTSISCGFPIFIGISAFFSLFIKDIIAFNVSSI